MAPGGTITGTDTPFRPAQPSSGGFGAGQEELEPIR